MSFLDKAKAKLTQAVDQHGDKISGGIDKAARMANEKTGGKHADKIDKATSKAREALDALDGKNDDLTDGGARTAHGTPGATTPPPAAPTTAVADSATPAPPPPPPPSATASAPEAPTFGTPAPDPSAPDPSAQPGLPTDPSNPATG